MGVVGFRVELHDEPPVYDEAWEEVVEVSFTPASTDLALVEWGGQGWHPLTGLEPIGYRVRYCAIGMEEARRADTNPDEKVVDRYLLQLWPGAAESDRVVRQTSESAAYWHRYARELPPPPTPEEKARAELQVQLEADRIQEEAHIQLEMHEWGGSLPSERLRAVVGNAVAMARLDRDLAEMVAGIDSGRQRAVARAGPGRGVTVVPPGLRCRPDCPHDRACPYSRKPRDTQALTGWPGPTLQSVDATTRARQEDRASTTRDCPEGTPSRFSGAWSRVPTHAGRHRSDAEYTSQR